jgi:cholesterol transport system auxiliary component
LDRWIASPPELLEQLLTSSDVVQDYVLLIRLHDFEQQFDAPDRARVVLRFFLEAYSVNDKQKIATQEFYLQQPTETPDAAGAINGFTKLARQVTGDIQSWLIGLSNHQH